MTDVSALREQYRDLSELDRPPEGIRYSATLPDGTPVVALAIAADVAARIRHPERFIAAFARAAVVHHEAIVPPVAWGQASDGTLHCAYAEGDAEPLAPGSLAPAGAAAAGVQLARALIMVHGAGLVHGAITAERIVVTAERGPQLGALGLFSALSDGGLGVQETTALLSDSAYVSPEVQIGKEPDERSDIFSMGASLYELLTGKPPYGGRTTSYVIASVLSDGGSDSRDDLAGPVVEALLRAIEREPDDRWPSASTFAQALAASVSKGERSAVVTKARRGRGCLPGVAVALAVLLGVSAAGVIARG